LWDQQCGKPCFKVACQSGNARQNHFTIAFGELASSGFPHWISLHVLVEAVSISVFNRFVNIETLYFVTD